MMKKLPYLAAALVLLAGAFLAGSWYGHQQQPGDTATGSATEAPVPVRDADQAATGWGDAAVPQPGSVQVSPERQQLIGLKTAVAEKRPGTWTLRLLGRVAADETRLYVINASIDCYITEALPVTTGTFVKKHQPLGSFYSPEFFNYQQSYINSVDTLQRIGAPEREHPMQRYLSRDTVRQNVDNLRNLGMSDIQIEEIARTRQMTQNVTIRAPAAGFLIYRNISVGQKHIKGAEMFRIADLRRVWVLADLFENDARHLQPGQTVKVHLPQQHRDFTAKVSAVLSLFDAATRTLKVRLEVDNPDYTLRPDMFVDVDLPVKYPPALTVPADAVLDSGLRKTVFIDGGDGLFNPREVETGRRFGDRVEIVKGLAEGDRYVASGNFLLDSESRMQLAASGVYGTIARDPVCGRDVSVRKAEREGRKSIHDGRTFYFSSTACKEQFDREPGRYAGKGTEAQPAAQDRGGRQD